MVRELPEHMRARLPENNPDILNEMIGRRERVLSAINDVFPLPSETKDEIREIIDGQGFPEVFDVDAWTRDFVKDLRSRYGFDDQTAELIAESVSEVLHGEEDFFDDDTEEVEIDNTIVPDVDSESDEPIEVMADYEPTVETTREELEREMEIQAEDEEKTALLREAARLEAEGDRHSTVKELFGDKNRDMESIKAPERKGIFGRIRGAVDRTKLAASRVWGRFKRSYTAEAEPEGEVSLEEVGYVFGATALDVAARVGGVRLGVDVVQKISQEIFSSRERSRLSEEMRKIEAAHPRMELSTEELAADYTQKAERIRTLLNSSTHLSSEQKEMLFAKIQAVEEEADRSMEASQAARDQKIADAIGSFVQAKKEWSEVGRQGVNTALYWSGLSVLRTIGYGSATFVKRAHRIWNQQGLVLSPGEERSRKQFARELIVDGVADTCRKLLGGEAKTWTGRLKNRAEALGVLATAYGMASVDLADVSRSIDDALNILESRTADLGPVITEPAAWLPEWVFLKETEKAVTLDDVLEVSELAFAESEIEDVDEGVVPELIEEVPPEPIVEQKAPESEREPVEVAEEPERAVVKRGDGVVAVIARVLKENPEAYGLANASEAKAAALEIAQRHLLLTDESELRFTQEAVGKLGIELFEKDDGSIGLKFVDPVSGEKMTSDALGKMLEVHSLSGDTGEVVPDQEVADLVDEPDQQEVGVEVGGPERLKVYGYQTVELSYAPDGRLSDASVEDLAEKLKRRDVLRGMKRVEMIDENVGPISIARKLEAHLLLLDSLQKQKQDTMPVYSELQERLYNYIQDIEQSKVAHVDVSDKRIRSHIGEFLDKSE